MEKVLLAGATGYLGSYIAKQLKQQNYQSRLLVRDSAKLRRLRLPHDEVAQAELLQPETLQYVCQGIDVVISTIGITRQKDGLDYMQVDYQANLNLLQQAQKSGVKKFIYISLLNGEQLQDIAICQAKEKFVAALKTSGMDYCIIRPNGFFSDLTEFYQMAKRGRAYIFAPGSFKINPIHGEDLAEVCVDAIVKAEKEIEIGGPEVLTHEQIAHLAFATAEVTPEIYFIPKWVRQGVLEMGKCFVTQSAFGPLEFFMTVMSQDMVAPLYGKHTLAEFFNEMREQDEGEKHLA